VSFGVIGENFATIYEPEQVERSWLETRRRSGRIAGKFGETDKTCVETAGTGGIDGGAGRNDANLFVV